MIKIKDIIIFAFGVGTGAVGMYFGVREKFRKEADAEISGMRDYVRSKIAECEGKTSAYKEQLDQYKLVTGEEYEWQQDMAEYENKAEYYILKSESDLAEAEHPEDDEEETLVDAMDIQEYRDREIKETVGPRIIDEDDFADYRHHDKETLYYYTEDMTLCDEDMEMIDEDDTHRLFSDVLDEFFHDDMQEEIYIRNVKVGADYYIQKKYESYDFATS